MTRALGLLPNVVVEPTDHPLAVDQRERIDIERLRAIVERLLHDQAARG